MGACDWRRGRRGGAAMPVLARGEGDRWQMMAKSTRLWRWPAVLLHRQIMMDCYWTCKLSPFGPS
uniref:Uncharacterized protein n=1 Tax=Oryza sativa subsp. japonica TaxID=39947 RepID=Q6K6C6_ORYSJ|nr:hypothetical protein [Oryza sativa Japonica Group]BAD23211.1 hypothetical protein [Oryza sativa Japonica Group]